MKGKFTGSVLKEIIDIIGDKASLKYSERWMVMFEYEDVNHLIYDALKIQEKHEVTTDVDDKLLLIY